jgi:hypothetical protein
MTDRTLNPTTQEDNRIAPITIDRKVLKIGKTRTNAVVVFPRVAE